jgi:hypothetical protein
LKSHPNFHEWGAKALVNLININFKNLLITFPPLQKHHAIVIQLNGGSIQGKIEKLHVFN